MIRRNVVSVKVKAPSRGLVTRYPSETADLFGGNPNAMQRAWAVAQNVRFEDGVVRSAPGYQRVALQTAALANAVAHFRFEEPSGTRFDSLRHNDLTDIPGTQSYETGDGTSVFPYDLLQVAGKLGFGAQIQRTVGAPGSFVSPYLHTASGDLATLAPPVTVCFWFKPAAVSLTSLIMQWAGMSLSQSGNVLSFSLFEAGPMFTGNATHTAPPPMNLAAGVWHFIVLVLQAGTMDVTVNGVGTTFTPTGAGGSFVAGGAHQFFIGNTANSVGFTIDSLTVWAAAVSSTITDAIYNSGTGLDFPFLLGDSGTLIYEANLLVANVASRPLVYGAGAKLYSVARSFLSQSGGTQYQATLTPVFTGNDPSTGYLWRACDFYDKVIFAQHDNVPQYWVGGSGSSHNLPGLAVNSTDIFSGASNGNEAFDGVESFFGHLLLWHNDTLIWSDLNDFANFIPVGITAVSATLATDGAHAFTQPAYGGTVAVVVLNPSGVNPTLAAGQFVRMIYTSGGVTTYNYYQVQGTPAPGATSFTLKLLGTTGSSAPGTDFTNGAAASQTITTLDANEAGTSRIVGANVNGPIHQVVALTDYAYIFKEWSVQSLQYVGQASGTFFLRTEVTREGLIGRNSLLNLGNGAIIFLGHRELYSYSGGSQPAPICQQYTRQLLAELDRTKLDQVILIHKEIRNEVWVIYPVAGGQKVLIWNYTENSATLDTYDSNLQGIKGGARVGWDIDPPWNSGADTQSWGSFPSGESWAFFSGTGHQELTLLATGDFGLLVHGAVFNRDGVAYRALAETMDFDFGDNAVFKYPDTVHFGLRVESHDNVTRNLYVQVGTRSALDSDITWSTAKAISVQGNANFTAKVNPGSGAGRYVRLRFYSQDTDVDWRISSYEIYGRAGGSY